jgi:hypothetical protein
MTPYPYTYPIYFCRRPCCEDNVSLESLPLPCGGALVGAPLLVSLLADCHKFNTFICTRCTSIIIFHRNPSWFNGMQFEAASLLAGDVKPIRPVLIQQLAARDRCHRWGVHVLLALAVLLSPVGGWGTRSVLVVA